MRSSNKLRFFFSSSFFFFFRSTHKGSAHSDDERLWGIPVAKMKFMDKACVWFVHLPFFCTIHRLWIEVDDSIVFGCNCNCNDNVLSNEGYFGDNWQMIYHRYNEKLYLECGCRIWIMFGLKYLYFIVDLILLLF